MFCGCVFSETFLLFTMKQNKNYKIIYHEQAPVVYILIINMRGFSALDQYRGMG